VDIAMHAKLSETYLAQGLSDEQVDRLLSIATPITLSKGDFLFKQHDKGDDLFVLLTGRLSVLASNNDVVNKVNPGGVVGELALLDERPRSATVVADVECELLRFWSESMRQMMKDECPIGARILWNISRTLSERLRSANIQIEALLVASGVDF